MAVIPACFIEQAIGKLGVVRHLRVVGVGVDLPRILCIVGLILSEEQLFDDLLAWKQVSKCLADSDVVKRRLAHVECIAARSHRTVGIDAHATNPPKPNGSLAVSPIHFSVVAIVKRKTSACPFLKRSYSTIGLSVITS